MVSCLFDTALVHVLGPSASVDEAPMASFSACAVCWTVAIMKNEASQCHWLLLLLRKTWVNNHLDHLWLQFASEMEPRTKIRKYHFILFWLELNLEYWCDEWSIITFNILLDIGENQFDTNINYSHHLYYAGQKDIIFYLIFNIFNGNWSVLHLIN